MREPSLPLVAIDFSFTGGSSQVPADKAGLASMVADLLDEGAGDLDARAFHEKVENYAISIGFSATPRQRHAVRCARCPNIRTSRSTF